MATLAEKLVEAESEYHALVTGNKAKVIVDQNGERVEFTATNSYLLAKYIEQLKRQLGTSSNRPMRVYF